jgi:hypothetical protein
MVKPGKSAPSGVAAGSQPRQSAFFSETERMSGIAAEKKTISSKVRVRPYADCRTW